MKKMFLTIITAFLAIFSLFADDSAALRRLIMQDNELIVAGKYAEVIKHYTTGFCSVDHINRKTTYKDLQMIVLMMDGSHPEEFMKFMFKTQAKREPAAEELAKIRELVNNDQFKTLYQTAVAKTKEAMAKSAEISLQTLKFNSIKINGNQAVVVWEYEELDPADITFSLKRKKSSTGKFLKVNGKWKFEEIKSRLILKKK